MNKQWGQMSSLKRSGLVLGLLLVVLAFAVGTYWLLQEDYQTLFSDLNPQDAAAMVAELDRLKVPYKLANDGMTILVERDAVYKTRLSLMGKGLNLNGAIGFEIFNNAEFGMTEFSQKVNYQRALQGELSRTIMAFDEVKSARVHLVLPESGLFKKSTAKPKASVSILLKDNRILSTEQISGIQRLVAASVPEILPSEVTVVDHRGVAVTRQPMMREADAALHERLDVKKQLEDYMARKIVSIVDRAVGPGKAIVSVDVSLNYDQIKVTKEDVVPLPNTKGQEVGAVVRRRENIQTEENWASSENVVNDTAEAVSNPAPSSSSTEVEFQNGRRIEQVLSSPGNILRLSVGVLVPDTANQAKLQKIKEMISMAVGINPARGDGLVVYSLDMPQPHNDENTDQQDQELVSSGSDPEEMPELVGAEPSTSRFVGTLDMRTMLMVLGAFLLIMLYLLCRKKPRSTKIDEQQRAKLLAEISQWARDAKSL
ncbi:flagellar M-ring protein FliF [Pseudomethylobacillus aquaticus]|uniref:Flagellar M-ring protein n=2 Tax=Pseudomethylobacillus aquaticus TaxID=2676064 RepID=A0A3N0UZV3_9PROT|nr:flagellar M-ring protein FliF [Pseudomethylobacillus aquaticus]